MCDETFVSENLISVVKLYEHGINLIIIYIQGHTLDH